MNLFDIALEYKQAYDELLAIDDLDPECLKDTLDGLSGDFETKAINTAGYIKNMEAQALAIKSAKMDMQARQSQLEKNIERLKKYLCDAMMLANIKSISTSPLFNISLKKNPPHINIVDEDCIPYDYITIRTEKVIDKSSMLCDLKEGKEIPGAMLKQETRVVIK
jgi:hypothetical protein